IFFFSSRRRHTRSYGDWSSDVCSSDLAGPSVRSSFPSRDRRPGGGCVRLARISPPAGGWARARAARDRRDDVARARRSEARVPAAPSSETDVSSRDGCVARALAGRGAGELRGIEVGRTVARRAGAPQLQTAAEAGARGEASPG